MGKAKAGTTLRRSRPLTHILGPGMHRTHLACAAIFTTIRMYYHVVLANIVPADVWAALWHQRERLQFGPFALLH
eukprot:5609438-Pyramimonas_sp.AAC.1